jgi:hypothetical protein
MVVVKLNPVGKDVEEPLHDGLPEDAQSGVHVRDVLPRDPGGPAPQEPLGDLADERVGHVLGGAGAHDHVGALAGGDADELRDALVGVRAVGVGDDDELARRAPDPGLEGGAVAAVAPVGHDAQPRVLRRGLLEDLSRAVRRAVVDDEKLEGLRVAELLAQVRHGLEDRALLVVAGHDHGESGRGRRLHGVGPSLRGAGSLHERPGSRKIIGLPGIGLDAGAAGRGKTGAGSALPAPVRRSPAVPQRMVSTSFMALTAAR